MTGSSFGASFARVDDTGDPQELLGYLDAVSALAAVKAAKRHSFDLLGLRDGSRCLDVGCGPGDDVLEMASRVGPTGHATGIDTSRMLIEEARARAAKAGLPVEFLVADAAALPFEDASLDGVRADRTFQHLGAPEAAMAEMARVCAPGGTIVVSELQNELWIDGGRPRDELSTSILSRFWSRDERRSWLGFMLPLLMQRAGLEPSLTQTAGQTTDFDAMDALKWLRAMADRAVEQGAVSQREAAGWLTKLREGAQDGSVVLHMRFMHFLGRVPSV